MSLLCNAAYAQCAPRNASLTQLAVCRCYWFLLSLTPSVRHPTRPPPLGESASVSVCESLYQPCPSNESN